MSTITLYCIEKLCQLMTFNNFQWLLMSYCLIKCPIAELFVRPIIIVHLSNACRSYISHSIELYISHSVELYITLHWAIYHTPWSYISHSMELYTTFHGAIYHTPWSYISHSMELYIRLHGAIYHTPWSNNYITLTAHHKIPMHWYSSILYKLWSILSSVRMLIEALNYSFP